MTKIQPPKLRAIRLKNNQQPRILFQHPPGSKDLKGMSPQEIADYINNHAVSFCGAQFITHCDCEESKAEVTVENSSVKTTSSSDGGPPLAIEVLATVNTRRVLKILTALDQEKLGQVLSLLNENIRSTVTPLLRK